MAVYVDIEKRLGKFLLKVKFYADNENLALLGPSGCGKTMTLKCIAGIEKPDRGRIIVDGMTLFDSERGINLSPQKRRTGLLFQNYALFPNMTVRQNLAAGAKREKQKALRERRIAEMLEAFDLHSLADRLPDTLSGGQQQRVALARILLSEPDVLLLDEPFSALDSYLRLHLQQELLQVLRNFGKTVILVSHDREEVYRMSDRVAVMEQGEIVECDKKERIFRQPATLQTARLTGCENILPVQLAGDWGLCPTVSPEISFLGIRAAALLPDEAGMPFRITERIDAPEYTTLRLVPVLNKDAQPLYWSLPGSNSYTPGQIVKICIPKEKLLLLRDGSEGKKE